MPRIFERFIYRQRMQIGNQCNPHWNAFAGSAEDGMKSDAREDSLLGQINIMKFKTLLAVCCRPLGVAALLAVNSVTALAVNEMRFVPDVVGQFNALTERPD